jgi:hypothetical protein
LLTTGDLITKGEAIKHLAGFGVPDSPAHEIRRRRDGLPVAVSGLRRLSRAVLARRIMQTASPGSAVSARPFPGRNG